MLVVTGDMGRGDDVARWLTANGAAHVVLAGRSAPPGDDPTRTVYSGDVTDPAAMRALLAGHDVRAVVYDEVRVHLAPLVEQDLGGLADVVAAKRDSLACLESALDLAALDAVVLFSSIIGVWGAGHHGAMAAANAYVDAWAHQRRAAGMPVTTVDWGLWDLGADDALADVTRTRAHGVRPMKPDLAFTALTQALDRRSPTAVIADVDWARFVPAFTLSRPSPLLGGVPEVREALATVAEVGTGAGSALRSRLVDLSAPQRRRALLDIVRAEVAAVLGHSGVDAVKPTSAFKDLGFDSLTGVDLRNRMNALTGSRLPATLVFDHPTPAALAHYLDTEVLGGADAPAVVDRGPVADADDPIVIIGMACRLPGGVTSPEDLWRLLADGRDAVTGFPTDRGWDLAALFHPDPDRPGTSTTRSGGFLDRAADFDAAFFGVNPREAAAMDPQQRLLLETSWEVFERAGIDPARAGRLGQVGVFVGTNSQDYAQAAYHATGGADAGYVGTGNAASVMSGRIAYVLGLEGPAVTVDTACSSSLVALHLAAQALRSGECDLALAGGATVMATPGMFVQFSQQRGLAPDGRCKAFSADADGTGLGEGVGLLLVSRLSDARRDGHEVLAVVRGSAVNQDGASNGLTAPNGTSQQRVIRRALANAGLRPSDVDVVEAHGTGTALGDPIEAQALIATYGQDRDRPLWLGSLKSNIGHTQGAAGVAGVIKMVMAMRHGLLPRTLHADEPSPHVDWSAGAVELLTEQVAWADDRPRRAGVSSFGISGTNVHVILEAAVPDPVDHPTRPNPTGVLPWVISAKSAEGLRDQARRLADHVPALGVADVGFSLATTRSGFEHRAVFVGATRDELVTDLRAFAGGTPGGWVAGVAPAVPGRTAFLFSGQGAQRTGMGRELYAEFPVFAAAFDAVCEELDAELGCSLPDIVWGTSHDLLNQTVYTQAGLFAVEVALFRLVESWGLVPDLLLGHSVGEVAAAHVSGVLLRDACRLVGARGRLMQALPAGGLMMALEAAEDEVEPVLTGRVAVAALNGPRSVVVSGDEEAVLEIAERFADQGRRTRRLAVSHAFHSPLMEPMLDDFRSVVAGLTFGVPVIPVVSNVFGAVASAVELRSAEYWVRHVRETVRFADGMRCLEAEGATTYLEIGPGASLTAMGQQCLAEPDAATLAPTLRADRPDARSVIEAVARLHVAGVSPQWELVFTGARRVDLPTYPFQRERFWPPAVGGPADASAFGLEPADHPLLGAVVALPDSDGLVLTGRLSLSTHRWLADHAVGGLVLFPGTGFVELAVLAGAQVGCGAVTELVLESPLVVPDEGAVDVRVTLGEPDDGGHRSVVVHSMPVDAPPDMPWTCHARGAVTGELPGTPGTRSNGHPAVSNPLWWNTSTRGSARAGSTTVRRSTACAPCGAAARRSTRRCRRPPGPRRTRPGSACTRPCSTRPCRLPRPLRWPPTRHGCPSPGTG
ncbi:hypothetical protein GCM10029964_054850 [Kibdelosporangium lantanae]